MKKENVMQMFLNNSYLFGGNAAYLEELYEQYLAEPHSVSSEWQDFFSKLPAVDGKQNKDLSHEAIKQQFIQLTQRPMAYHVSAGSENQKQSHVLQLIDAYRAHGHQHAKLDPLSLWQAPRAEDLELQHHGLTQADLNVEFSTNSYQGLGKNKGSLQEILNSLKAIYCNTLGIEYKYITDTTQTAWLEQRIESTKGKPAFSKEEKLAILRQLTAAEGLEVYLGKKYVGQKRFSLEGSDSLLPILHEIVGRAIKREVKELVIGMAHRGRLNVLINLLGKAPSQLFQEFEGVYLDEDRTGDVKYHLGFSSDLTTTDGSIHVALGFNPSHLEIISPVIEGTVRVRQERRKDAQRNLVVPIVIHGDAAFAGQGVVMETFNMSQARGYTTGGTIHIVVNNQIGFTTSNPHDARSTYYCTDIAKMVQAPILHVNGDDPEAVVFATQIAFDYRMKFNKDVVIDLVSYRRHGHNEADEPTMTQPVMYRAIKNHLTPLTLYAQQLQKEGTATQAQIDEMMAQYRATLDKGEIVVKRIPPDQLGPPAVNWKKYLKPIKVGQPVLTGVKKEILQALGQKLLALPAGFKLQPQVAKEWENRQKMLTGELPLFWGMAETLAYASLVTEGYPVRLSGQDSGRGTFSHRHAVLHDYESDTQYTPLQHLAPNQSDFTVIDSVLSEEAVLAFEYGYSTADPERLVIWEAQFGDFFNGAQVVVDQFISSGEQKWGRMSALTMLLPHGQEGMGPEHSSARLERFLQLCAQQNMQVVVPTTPAQCFHMIRRQMHSEYRKPLIVMSPKSMLRHKQAVSSLDDLVQGHFMEIIPEQEASDKNAVNQVILCSGKVYYDLVNHRQSEKITHTDIIRVEQLYPFPQAMLTKLLSSYKQLKEVVWCQEEPENQGGWHFAEPYIQASVAKQISLRYAGRPATAAPAVGYATLHTKQQQALVEDAFSIKK